jgi:hypothetical protein
MPTGIPGHNAVFVLFGCLLAMLAWRGLNVAGGILFSGGDPRRAAIRDQHRARRSCGDLGGGNQACAALG